MNHLNPSGLFLVVTFIVVVLITVLWNAFFKKSKRINLDHAERLLIYFLTFIAVIFAAYIIISE